MVAQIHFYGGATESFVGQMFFYFGCFEEVGISSTGCGFFFLTIVPDMNLF